jgi:hypothetical protein
LPVTAHSTSIPGENASTIASPSCWNAVSSAPSSSSAPDTFEIPTEDPSRAGLTNSGSPSSSNDARTASGVSCHAVSRTAR